MFDNKRVLNIRILVHGQSKKMIFTTCDISLKWFLVPSFSTYFYHFILANFKQK